MRGGGAGRRSPRPRTRSRATGRRKRSAGRPRDKRIHAPRAPRQIGSWTVSQRTLMLSWEYPPVIEGGLARHVRKLAEGLVRHDVPVDVLTRGAEGSETVFDGPGRATEGRVAVH